MRKKVIAGNWKMNLSLQEGIQLAKNIAHKKNEIQQREVIVAPQFLHLPFVQKELEGTHIKLAAQNCASSLSGAYTGEVSPQLIQEIGCQYCIVGHSERRKHFLENENNIIQKTQKLWQLGIIPIVCVGEELEARKNKQEHSVVEKQLEHILIGVEKEKQPIIIGYEPIWAIGTGTTATPQQAQDMHLFIRKLLEKYLGKNEAESISLIYGGSVNSSIVKSFISQEDIDGFLVGGASLHAEEFLTIILETL